MAWIHVASVSGTSRNPYNVCLQTEGESHGKLGCSCPAWTRGVNRRVDCKHIRAVLGALRMVLKDRRPRTFTWEDTRRVTFLAAAGDLFCTLLEHGVEGLELDDLTKMAVLAESSPSMTLPTLNWRV
jgi:hypothetical protein